MKNHKLTPVQLFKDINKRRNSRRNEFERKRRRVLSYHHLTPAEKFQVLKGMRKDLKEERIRQSIDARKALNAEIVAHGGSKSALRRSGTADGDCVVMAKQEKKEEIVSLNNFCRYIGTVQQG